jgi:DNA-binding PadR family transcriptional regulator
MIRTVSTIRLGPTSYLVLGMIALRGPSTPYALKRAVARSVGYFWPFAHAQFYGEPARLVDAGLLTESREETGRRRRTYAITDSGRAALRSWLGEPTPERMEIRDIGELKLFFGELGSTADLVALAREQEGGYRAVLAELAAIEARFGDDPLRRIRMIPLDLGRRLFTTAAEFWAELAENPPR